MKRKLAIFSALCFIELALISVIHGFSPITGRPTSVGVVGRWQHLYSTTIPGIATTRNGCSVRENWCRGKYAAVSSSTAEYEDRIKLKSIDSISGDVVLPGSKSFSNRVVLLSALAEGTTLVENILHSEDTRYMFDGLEALGVNLKVDCPNRRVNISGKGGVFDAPNDDVLELFLGNAGTAMRPLAAVLCCGSGSFVLDGTQRMRERPIVDLVDGLRQLGADITCSDTGCPPVRISSHGLPGGTCRVSGQISSQFLSSLLMAAPLAQGPVTIEITDELVSAPYVQMTVSKLQHVNIVITQASHEDYYNELLLNHHHRITLDKAHEEIRFTVHGGQRYSSPGHIMVEGDASSASYFLGGAAITGGRVRVQGCGLSSIQGDVQFATVLEKMGAKVEWEDNAITVTRDSRTRLRGVDVDCADIPDAAMTLAVIALFAEGPTTIRNVYNWRLKETERMKAIVTELTKLGGEVEEGRDYCKITPPTNIKSGAVIETYDDHRMAMAFSLAACGTVDIEILNPECTAKTFPTYFTVLEKLAKRRVCNCSSSLVS